MAMGNFCYEQEIECPYATVLGCCVDGESGLCEMLGDKMKIPTVAELNRIDSRYNCATCQFDAFECVEHGLCQAEAMDAAYEIIVER